LLKMLVVDRNSVAYFYAVTEDGFEPPKVAGEKLHEKLALYGVFKGYEFNV
jgi:hypothetical protein